MTTIAVNRFTLEMAADLQISDDGRKYKSAPKIWRAQSYPYYLMASAGDVGRSLEFEEWFKLRYKDTDTFHKRIWKGKDVKTLVLLENKSLWYYQDGLPILITDQYFALGSGGDYALGALYASNGNVKEAIRIASLCDIHTGLGIQYESLHTERGI